MSQYYPQQSPVYPPEFPPEDVYYDEDDYEYIEENEYGESSSNLIQYALAFFAGGCLVFIFMSCCFLLAGGLWTLDAILASTPVPGSELGLSYDDPAYPGESVVNDQMVRLTVSEVNRNASLPTVPVVEGRELIIVTIELDNLGDEEVNYNERDFSVLNSFNEEYIPTPGETIIEGALGRGRLDPDEGLSARLVFEVRAGEPELVLAWQSGRDSEPRYFLLQ
jgi:hypothetical protein